MKPIAWIALAALACVALPAGAATYRVDDGATQPYESAVALRWRSVAPTRGGDDTMEGATTVQVRLNLAPWLNRQGRIYLALPEQPPGKVVARWTTQGRLLPGQVGTGQRTLVYAGPITTPLLAETLALRIEADGNRMAASYRLNFHFEIDVD
jgi:hypothetical protein